MDGSAIDAGRAALSDNVRTMLNQHWVPEGYAAPNSDVYPWLWLWDSCFHSLIWAALGDERAITELDKVFAAQDDAGFVPHMNFERDPKASIEFWGRPGSSSITQPPMFGHTIASLVDQGLSVAPETIENAVRGLRFLVRERARSESGLLQLVHPWESGADDSPRWDDMVPGGWNIDDWRALKTHLVGTVQTNAVGSPIHNPEFPVASIGFNALVAFNIFELERVTGVGELHDAAVELADAITTRWDASLGTYVDEGPTATREGSRSSGSAGTLDALLGALVDPDAGHVASIASMVMDPTDYGGACGPAAVHRNHPTYDPMTYWRGPAWPQLSYLMAIAMERRGHDDIAAAIADATMLGAERSGLAEYWHPDSGVGLGAIPQSWAGLAIVLAVPGDRG